MSVVLRAGTGGQSAFGGTSFSATLPTGSAAGDLVMISVQCTNADVTYTATSGWTKLVEYSNILNTNLCGAIFYRVLTGTPTAPTITFVDGVGGGGSYSWSSVAFSPGAGGILSVDNVADAGKFAAAGTSMPVNARTAAASEVASVIVPGYRSNTINSASITSTAPTNYTAPSGTLHGTQMSGTTSGNENIGTNIFYRLGVSGTVAPGNVIISRDASSSIWHYLIKETVPASIKAVGSVVDGGSAATSITLPVPATAAVGDYLVAALYSNLGTSSSDWAMGSTGFTRIGPAFIASDLGQRVGGLFGQRLTSTPPTSYTFTTPDSGGSTRNVGVIIVLSNVDAAAPISASTAWTEVSTAGTSLSIPGGGTAGNLTLEYITTDFASPNSYAGAANDSGLTSQAILISPAGTENTGISRTMVRIYGDIAPAGGVPAHTFSTTSSSSHRAAFLVSFKGGSTSNLAASVAFTGSGALDSTGQALGIAATATLTGSGTLSAVTKVGYVNGGVYAGSGTLTATSTLSYTTSASFTGSGALTTTQSAVVGYSRNVDLTGSGALTAVSTPQQVQSGAFTGAGTLTATSKLGVTRAATLTGTGALSAATATVPTAWAFLAGDGALAATVTAPPVQSAFRGRLDDGTETTATWLAAVNTGWSQAVNTTFRVRFEVRAAGLTTDLQLYAARNGGAYQAINGTSTIVRSVAALNVSDDAGTSRQFGGTGTYVTGGFDAADGYLGPFTFPDADGVTEVEYAIQIRAVDVAANDTITLRLRRGDGTTFTTYTASPTLTVLSTTRTASAALSGSGALTMIPSPSLRYTAAMSGVGSLRAVASKSSVLARANFFYAANGAWVPAATGVRL